MDSFAPIPLINILERKRGMPAIQSKSHQMFFNTYFKNIRDKSEIITIEQSPSTTKIWQRG